MKWLIGIVLVLAALAVAAFGAGYYLLPATMEFTRTVDVARPASIIYPMVSNLRTFNEFSPWFDRDPKADYVFEGPLEGEGQKATWSSSVKEVGEGSQTIVKAVQDQSVETDITFGGSAKAKARFDLKPITEGTTVSWTFISPCGPAITGVPCRYMNLMMQPEIAKQYDSGLAKLKVLAEQLPALDISVIKPERVIMPALDWAYVEGETTQDQSAITSAMRQSFGYVQVFFDQNGLIAAGPPMAVTTKWDGDKYGFRAGVPFSGPAPAVAVGVKVGRTPAGPALKITHTGTFETKRTAYAQLAAYMAAHRLKAAGDPWETYVKAPATPAPAPAVAAAPATPPAEGEATPTAAPAAPVAVPQTGPVDVTEIYYPIQ